MQIRYGWVALAVAVVCGCGDNEHRDPNALLVSPETDLMTTEAGGATTFTVALAEIPFTQVTVTLTSMDPGEGTVSPSELVFTIADFSEPRMVTLKGVDDERADGNVTYQVRLEADDQRVDVLDVDVVNADNDTAGVAVSPTAGLITSEAGATKTFEVHLLSQPEADVMVPVASNDASEGIADRNMLTFTPENWSTPQVVTVTGQQDLIADGSINYKVVLGAVASVDSRYQGIDPDDVALQNLDDDVRGVAVTAPASLATTEAGGTATFTVALQSEPTANVTIAVSSTKTTEATTSTAQLVFTPADWNQPQTVTVTGANDFVDDDDQPFEIVLAAATSADTMYNAFDPGDLDGINADDDTAGILVTPTEGLLTTEDGEFDSFTVVLQSEPTANVTIGVASSDGTEGKVSATSLTFTPSNWDQPQPIIVTGLDDLIADNDVDFKVVLDPAVSTDTKYAGIDPTDVGVTNQDDDIAGVTVDPVDGLQTSEFGDTDDFTIVLDTAPMADVTINLTSSDTTEGKVSPSSVTFTPGNWNVPQTVTVTGVDDALADANIDYKIVTSAAVTTDPVYSGMAVDDVLVTNFDNDTAQVFVKARKRLRVSEDGTQARIRVRLTLAPTATVTCTLASSDTTEGIVSTSTLTFQPNQFNFQNVFVIGVDDAIVDGPIPFTVVFNACTSADPQYNTKDPRDVPLFNEDND